MKIKIFAVGKSHDPLHKDAINEYEDRLKRYVRLEWEYVTASTKEQESEQLLRRSNGYVILLDETGRQFTSPEISSLFDTLQNKSEKQVTLLIGGAFGVTEEVKQQADSIWSFSNLVFPHQLMRLLLVEQLYRAYDIMHAGKYHHY